VLFFTQGKRPQTRVLRRLPWNPGPRGDATTFPPDSCITGRCAEAASALLARGTGRERRQAKAAAGHSALRAQCPGKPRELIAAQGALGQMRANRRGLSFRESLHGMQRQLFLRDVFVAVMLQVPFAIQLMRV